MGDDDDGTRQYDDNRSENDIHLLIDDLENEDDSENDPEDSLRRVDSENGLRDKHEKNNNLPPLSPKEYNEDDHKKECDAKSSLNHDKSPANHNNVDNTYHHNMANGLRSVEESDDPSGTDRNN